MERRRVDKKAKPKDEVEEEVEDQVSESDAEEAEIWKVMHHISHYGLLLY